MDSRSRLNDGPAKAPNSLGTDREERLLRFVDILRTEQVRASIGANADGGGTGFRRWRGLALLLAVMVVAIGAAAAFLRAPGPSPARPDATPDSAAATASVRAPEPAPPGRSALPSETAHSHASDGAAEGDAPAGGPVNPDPTPPVPGVPPEPALAGQSAADPADITGPTAPPAAIATRPDPIKSRALRHEPDAVAAPPVRAEAEVSEPETAKPVLLVYYPHGSRLGDATARSLATRIGSEVTSSDIKTPTSLPDDAMIVFSEERNHEFARMIGKSLGDSGYRWKIEKIPSPVGTHSNMIEVWLPMK
jgi:hypothetical protein